MRYALFFLILINCAIPAFAQRRVHLPAALTEISGMACTPDGALWALNDSGNDPVLFQLDAQSGQIIHSRRLPVPNRDWEDLAADKQGNLYIADIGNNRNNRRDLCVFRYNIATQALDSIQFRYSTQQAFPPDNQRQWLYDCEALVWYGDSLHLFTKSRFASAHWVYHFILPAQPGQYVAVLKDSLLLKNRVVSGAGLSNDGSVLALTSYMIGKHWGFLPYTKASVYWFEAGRDSQFLRHKKSRHRLPKFLIARQFESVVQLPNGRWVAANEGIWVQKPKLYRLHK
jgi:hypothetical protein